MLLKLLLTKFRNPWVWGTSLIFCLGASAWGVEQGFIATRIKQEKNWNLEAKRLERRVKKILPQFPDLKTLHSQLAQQEKELDHLQKGWMAFDAKVLGTSALSTLLKGDGAVGGAFGVRRIGLSEDQCQTKPYVCDTFEAQGKKTFSSIVKYLDALERSSPMLEILELEVVAGETGGVEPPEVKIRVAATHSPVK